jgi:hypothetical protein
MPIRLSGSFGFSGFFGPGTGQITQNSELRTQNSQLRTTSSVALVSPIAPSPDQPPSALRTPQFTIHHLTFNISPPFASG